MKLVVDVPDDEFALNMFLANAGMGSAAIRRILDGKPYEEGIQWHPYPQEKPNDDREVLVTFREKFIEIATYIKEYSVFIDSRECMYIDRVTAWAELPKPYDGGAEK